MTMTRLIALSSSASRISRSFGASRRTTRASPLSSARAVASASGPSPISRTQVGPPSPRLARAATQASMSPRQALQGLDAVGLAAGRAGVDRLPGGVDDPDRDVEAAAPAAAGLGPAAGRDVDPRGQVARQRPVEVRGRAEGRSSPGRLGGDALQHEVRTEELVLDLAGRLEAEQQPLHALHVLRHEEVDGAAEDVAGV